MKIKPGAVHYCSVGERVYSLSNRDFADLGECLGKFIVNSALGVAFEPSDSPVQLSLDDWASKYRLEPDDLAAPSVYMGVIDGRIL